jgi:hypothetical protein
MTTFNVGDMVTVKRYGGTYPVGSTGTVIEVIDVPPENIEFNPRIPPENNETGVGHHQHLVVGFGDGSRRLYSGAFFEDNMPILAGQE